MILHLFYHFRTLPIFIPIALTLPYVVALDAVLYGGNIVSEPLYTKERKKGRGNLLQKIQVAPKQPPFNPRAVVSSTMAVWTGWPSAEIGRAHV